MVEFSPNGQPIGSNAKKLSLAKGQAVKTHVPCTYENWAKVSEEFNERVFCTVNVSVYAFVLFNISINLRLYIWNFTLNSTSSKHLFDVTAEHRESLLKKANLLRKDWKQKLRRDYYDKYPKDAERKNDIPSYIKKEYWLHFVEICSTPNVQAARKIGRQARQAMKCPHTSSRKGQARVTEEMVQKICSVGFLFFRFYLLFQCLNM